MTSVHRRVLIYIFLLGCSILVATATEDTTECEVRVGPSVGSSNIKSANVSEGCVCPAVVNKNNWLGGHQYGDWFAVTQNGVQLQVRRGDTLGGWGMDLAFTCVSKECEVRVGPSVGSSNIKSATVSSGCVCPAVINKDNWLGGHQFGDWFAVTQNGGELKVQRKDTLGGWGMDLAFMCEPKGFSISGGPTPNEGNVFYNDAPICDHLWDNVDALVFCRMFGYQDGTATHRSKYGHVSSHFSMDDVRCNGNEDSLRDCSYTTQENCDHSEGAGVICSAGGTVLIHTDAKYEYYKVPVPASSKMLSAVILTTCSNFGFTPQCDNANYADDNCVQAPDTSFDVQHPRAMSKILCNTIDPRDCADTVNMFWYMGNDKNGRSWASGSACGAIKGRGFGSWCSAGVDYTSTSEKQYYAACVKPL